MADGVVFTEEQQEHVNKLIGEARIKAREQAQAASAAEQQAAQEAAEREALAAKAEWEKLAKRHEARVAELEPLQQQVAAYQAAVDSLLADKVKALGDSAKAAVEALPASLSTLEKLEWLNRNSGLFQAASGAGGGTPKRPGQTKPEGTEGGKLSTRFPIKL